MLNLTKRLGVRELAIAAAAALFLTPSKADAGDYVKVDRFGLPGIKAGYRVTYTHTEPRLVEETYRFSYMNDCGQRCEGTGIQRVVREVITSQCTRSYVDWDNSIVAAPGNLLKAIGDAITPKGNVCHNGYVPMYIAPVPRQQCCPQVQQGYTLQPRTIQPAPQPTPALRPKRFYPDQVIEGEPTPAPPQDQSRNGQGLNAAPINELQVPPEPVPDTGRQ